MMHGQKNIKKVVGAFRKHSYIE